MGFFKKSVFVVLSFLLLFSSFAIVLAKVSHAEEPSPWYNQSYDEWEAKVYDEKNPQEIFGERYTAAQVQWIVYSLIAMITPTPPEPCHGESADIVECFKSIIDLIQNNTAMNDYSPGPGNAVLALASFSDTLLTTPPVSGISYTANLLKRFSIVPESYAQGVGYQAFEPVLLLWRASRNIAYALSIIVIIAMSLMIMFRSKVNPQTVITIQSALPKLIIAIILIAFSYAIAGFVFDLTNLLFGLISLIVKTSGISTASPPSIQDILSYFYDSTAFGAVGGYAFIFLIVAVAFFFLTSPLFLAGPLAFAFGAIVWLPILILAVMMVMTVLRIFWLLLRTYVTVIFLVILAPFQIIFGTLSERSGGFGAWLRNLFSNMIVFPTVGLMFVLAQFFFWGSLFGAFPSLLTNPPFSLDPINPMGINVALGGDISFPFFNSTFAPSLNTIGFFVSFAILWLIPQAANIVRAAAQGEQFNYGTALGQATAPGIAAAKLDTQRRVQKWEVKDATAFAGTAAATAGMKYQGTWWGNWMRNQGWIR